MAATDRRLARPATTLIVLALTVAAGPVPASADESSGSWTGAVEARGNYYWETSTRVVAPSVDVELESPEGVQLDGHYLVDSITSASQAAGTQTDVAFTEIRHDFGLGGGYEFDLGEPQLRVGASSRFSFEPDYTSYGAGVDFALSLNRRATVLRASVFYIHDVVGQKIRGADRSAMGRDLSDRGTIGTLDSVATTFVWDQVLSPTVTLQLGYDLVHMQGFLANAYRMVSVQGVLRPETHPDLRVRHAGSARLAYYHRPTGTAFHLKYRAYIDNWDVAALTPEVRIYQELGAFAQLRARYRYYTQTKSFFYEQDPAQYGGDDEHFTADPKMSEFESHLAGLQLLLMMDFLHGTSLEWADEASIDLSFDYLWRTNRFGNGVIAEAGLRIPF